MKVQKVVRAQGEFAKIGGDIKEGDALVIRDEGQVISGDYGDRNVFRVEKKSWGEEKNLTFNQTSMNNIIDAYGEDTKEWVGKIAHVYIVRQMVGDTLKNVCYLVGDGWVMNDSGKFIPIVKQANLQGNSKSYPSDDDEDVVGLS
jgi:hypothetical protein